MKFFMFLSLVIFSSCSQDSSKSHNSQINSETEIVRSLEASASSVTAPTGSTIVEDIIQVPFGTILNTETKSLRATIRNNSTAGETIVSATRVADPTNYFTQVSSNCSNIKPKSSCDIRMSFNGKVAPQNAGGAFGGQWTLTFSDNTTKTVQMNINVDVPAPPTEEQQATQQASLLSNIVFTPVSVDFGEITDKESKTMSISVRNNNSVSVTFPSAAQLPFTLTAGCSTIAAKGTCTARVALSGAGKSGEQLGKFFYGTREVPLSGIVKSTAQVIIDTPLVENILESATVLAFGDVKPTDTITRQVSFTNKSNLPVTLQTNLSNPNFSITSNSCNNAQVAVNSSCTVRISLSGAGKTAGPITGTLTYGTTGSVELTANILSQEAVIAATPLVENIEESLISLAFGDIKPTDTIIRQVTFTNKSNLAVTLPVMVSNPNFLISSNGCSGSLAVNSSCTVRLSLSGAGKLAGPMTGTLTYGTTGSVALTANILSQEVIQQQEQEQAQLNSNVVMVYSGTNYSHLDTLNIGSKNQGVVEQIQFSLRNTGTASATVSSVAFASNMTIISNSCITTLAPNSSCNIRASLNPQSQAPLSLSANLGFETRVFPIEYTFVPTVVSPPAPSYPMLNTEIVAEIPASIHAPFGQDSTRAQLQQNDGSWIRKIDFFNNSLYLETASGYSQGDIVKIPLNGNPVESYFKNNEYTYQGTPYIIGKDASYIYFQENNNFYKQSLAGDVQLIYSIELDVWSSQTPPKVSILYNNKIYFVETFFDETIPSLASFFVSLDLSNNQLTRLHQFSVNSGVGQISNPRPYSFVFLDNKIYFNSSATLNNGVNMVNIMSLHSYDLNNNQMSDFIQVPNVCVGNNPKIEVISNQILFLPNGNVCKLVGNEVQLVNTHPVTMSINVPKETGAVVGVGFETQLTYVDLINHTNEVFNYPDLSLYDPRSFNGQVIVTGSTLPDYEPTQIYRIPSKGAAPQILIPSNENKWAANGAYAGANNKFYLVTEEYGAGYNGSFPWPMDWYEIDSNWNIKSTRTIGGKFPTNNFRILELKNLNLPQQYFIFEATDGKYYLARTVN